MSVEMPTQILPYIAQWGQRPSAGQAAGNAIGSMAQAFIQAMMQKRQMEEDRYIAMIPGFHAPVMTPGVPEQPAVPSQPAVPPAMISREPGATMNFNPQTSGRGFPPIPTPESMGGSPYVPGRPAVPAQPPQVAPGQGPLFYPPGQQGKGQGMVYTPPEQMYAERMLTQSREREAAQTERTAFGDVLKKIPPGKKVHLSELDPEMARRMGADPILEGTAPRAGGSGTQDRITPRVRAAMAEARQEVNDAVTRAGQDMRTLTHPSPIQTDAGQKAAYLAALKRKLGALGELNTPAGQAAIQSESAGGDVQKYITSAKAAKARGVSQPQFEVELKKHYKSDSPEYQQILQEFQAAQ